MREKTVVVVKQPRDRLWDALCERTCDLAGYIESIESAELKSRETTPEGLVRCVHVWRARSNLPAILARHLDGGLLEWTAHTEWRADAYESLWQVKPSFMKGAVLCAATLSFAPAIGGRGTRLGLDLEVQGIDGAAGFQAITSTMLTGHFRKLVDAATQLIEED